MGRHAASSTPRRLAVGAVVVGCLMASFGLAQGFAVSQQQSASQRVMPAPTVTALSLPPARPEPQHEPPGSSTPAPSAGKPVRISVPSIGLEARVDVELGVTREGELTVPADPGAVGWWKDGPRPGEAGAAVLVGHKDSATGPAVFYGVGDVLPGDRVHVEDAQGSIREFQVTAVEQVDKYEFPTAKVYGRTTTPELRLLTCGGEFDEKTQEYEDNFIVYASAL